MEKAIKKVRDTKATGDDDDDDDVPGDVIKTAGRRWSQKSDTTDQQHIWNWRVALEFHSSYNDCLKEEANSYKMQWSLHNQPHRIYNKDSDMDT